MRIFCNLGFALPPHPFHNGMMKGIKLLVALLLLPALLGLGLSVADLASRWFPAGEWKSLWFLSGGTGFGLWLMVYYCLPRPMWMYVLGHELTHAWAVWLAGGRVYDFKVTSDGGHVKSDRVNWFIALAPYFIPLYSLIWLMLWWSVDFWYPLHTWQWLYFGGLGFTWGFHLTFTVSMILLGQTDISGQGYVFSFVCIASANLLFILAGFVVSSDHLTWMDALFTLGRWTGQAYSLTGMLLWKLIKTGAGWFEQMFHA
jgi:hypothetical protein